MRGAVPYAAGRPCNVQVNTKSEAEMAENTAAANDANPMSERSERVYQATVVERDQHAEGPIARLIEQQTAKLPSDVFLFASLTAMGVSLYAELTGRREMSRFVGQWAPTLLILGVYNKLVKLIGDR